MSRFRHAYWRSLGPDFGLTLAFLAALATLVAAFGTSFVWGKGPILWAGGILTALVMIALLSRLPAIVRGQTRRLARGRHRGPRRRARLGAVHHHHVGVREHGDVHGGDPQDGDRRRALPTGPETLRRRADRLGRPLPSPAAHRLDVAGLRALLRPADGRGRGPVAARPAARPARAVDGRHPSDGARVPAVPAVPRRTAPLLPAAARGRVPARPPSVLDRPLRDAADRLRRRRSAAGALGFPVAALLDRLADAVLFLAFRGRAVPAPPPPLLLDLPAAGRQPVALDDLPAPPLDPRHRRRPAAGSGLGDAGAAPAPRLAGARPLP